MKTGIFLFVFVFPHAFFGQNHLQAEIKSLEILIDSLAEKKSQEITNQQVLLDNQLWREKKQRHIVDSLSVIINDIEIKISDYRVNEDQVSAYLELIQKEIWIEGIDNKKPIKFVNRIKKEHPNWNSKYKLIYTSHSVFIVNNLVELSDTPILTEISFSEKTQKNFDKLIKKEILTPLGATKAIYLNEIFGLDKEYFKLVKKIDELQINMLNASDALNEIKNQKETLIKNISITSDAFSKKIEKIQQLIDFNKSLKTVKIGNQIWMVDNLNVSTFRNGDPIVEVQDERDWRNCMWFGKPAYCYWGNNSRPDDSYGLQWNTKLYNWFVISDPRGIAPEGWRVPSDEDWAELEKTLGKDAGLKMKSKNGWKSKANYESGNGNNLSGFSGIPGGLRDHNGQWLPDRWPPDTGYWWSSTTANEPGKYRDGSIYQGSAWNRVLGYGTNELGRWDSHKGAALSIRLIKDD